VELITGQRGIRDPLSFGARAIAVHKMHPHRMVGRFGRLAGWLVGCVRSRSAGSHLFGHPHPQPPLDHKPAPPLPRLRPEIALGHGQNAFHMAAGLITFLGKWQMENGVIAHANALCCLYA